MKINVTNNVNHVVKMRTNNQLVGKTKGRFNNQITSLTNKNNNHSIWVELAQEYDVRNMSFKDLCNISTRLYDNGQITLKEHALFTFDPQKSVQKIKSGINLLPTDANSNKDWIKEYETRYQRDLKLGNTMGYTTNKHLLTILNKLENIEQG